MTTLITGGTGFIGAEVVRLLLARGEQRPVVFHMSGNTQRLNDIVDQIELVRGDLANFSHILDVVKKVKPSVIYHLGAMLSLPSEADPAAAIHVNAMGTFHILEAARLFDVPQVLFSSSISTYGLGIEGEEVIDDATLQRPVFFYGATKLLCDTWASSTSVDTAWISAVCATVHRWPGSQDPGGSSVYLVGDRGMCQRKALYNLGTASYALPSALF